MAWVYDRCNKDFTLPGLQAVAKRDWRGLWVDAEPVPPWEYRRPAKNTKAALPQNSDYAICFVHRHGEYRVLNGKKTYGC
jgi:micrococcal nuclease